VSPAIRETRERYQARRDEAAARRDQLAARARTVSNLRLLAFGTGIGALVWAEIQPERGAAAFTLAALSALAFFVLVAVHSRLTQRRRRAAEHAAINEEALARLGRDWDDLPPVSEAGPPGHGYAHDLDIFGHGSLARFLGTAGTGFGRQRLHGWLLEPAPVRVARHRQDGVRELVPRLDFRQDLQVAGRLADDPNRAALDAFLDWAEDRPWLGSRPWLLWVARILPIATLALLVLHLEGTLQRPWWIPTLAAGTLLSIALAGRLHRQLARASLGDASLRHFAGLVERIQAESFESETLQSVRAALTDGCDARTELARLGWLTELADLRHGGLFYVLIQFPTLWDFHVLWGLERWQQRAGRHAREWIDRIAEIDALAALAGPALDEPGWSFPRLGSEGDRVVGRGLAHPLLPPGERVPNDVNVGPPGTFVMVTGSNMSGKSTLLRAIGVNAVLAQAGGPVCATELSVPPLEIRSSMRVEDSLERGVSLFMAELQQLKRVVDAADRPDERVLLYLLDEVLHGTNTAERQVAIREVLGHLLERRAIGAISTHDLALADTAALEAAVVPVHFRETVHPEGHEPPMSFDYVLREGVATSTNAMKLVRLVGLA
jgi:hypothetical protein